MARGKTNKRGKGNGAAGDKDEFDQGGPDGPRRQRAANDDDHGTNGGVEVDGEVLAEFLEVVDRQDAEVEQTQERMRLRNEPDKAKIAKAKKVITEAKQQIVRDMKISTEVLNAVVRRHRLKRDAENVDKHLDEGARREFRTVAEAMGAYADTPLGKAAIEREHAEA